MSQKENTSAITGSESNAEYRINASQFWNLPELVAEFNDGVGILGKVVELLLVERGFYDDLTNESSILEVGVGANSYIDPRRLPEHLNRDAVDFAPNMLKRLEAKNFGLYNKLIVSDATALDIPSDIYDRVMSPYMMRYLTPDDQLKAISEMIRTAKAGGRVDIFDLQNSGFHDYALKQYPFIPDELKKLLPGTEYPFLPDVLKERMNTAEFQRMLSEKSVTINVTNTPIDLSHFSERSNQSLWHMRIDVSKSPATE